MLTVDDRCDHPRCNVQNIYRMVGKCSNCGQTDILVLISAEHESRAVKCPRCGCKQVRPSRLATDDEIPVA